MRSFFLEIFTWWNNQTFGTRVFTFLNGKKVGSDSDGNIFYVHKKNANKRWVIYNGLMDASRIQAIWHDWIHHRTDEIPNQQDLENLDWYKHHKSNTTGTIDSYFPNQLNSNISQNLQKHYKAWQPETEE